MNNIIKKPMSDVTVPQGGIVRRQSTFPQSNALSSSEKETGRIEGNPFFERSRRKTDKKEVSIGQKKTPRYWSLVVAFFIVLLLAGGFLILNYFARATITVEPISKNATLDNNFLAVKNGSGEEFVFKSLSLTEERSKEVPATIEKKIQKRASGKVIIYNSYSKMSQRLVINTRLESPEHKIFRLEKSVVVPGATVVDGNVIVPGQVEALVFADVPGKEYNIGLSNFTLPGLKGDPRYTKFKASSVTNSPIEGGFSGTIMSPGDEVVAAALEEVKQELKKVAIEKAKAQIPDSETFFPGSMIIKFEDVPQDFTKDKTAAVVARATITVFFIDTVALTKEIIKEIAPEEKDKLFSISNLSSLAFSFIDPVDNVVVTDLSNIRFHLSGSVSIVGRVDSEKIRTKLLGKKKADFGAIIKGENNIYKVDMEIRPMWKSTFPTDPSKISVKIVTK